VAKIHQKISDIRCDDLHQLSTRLIRENQTIVVEDLNVRGMMANHSLAGAIGDSGWSELVRQLEYKSAWHGRTFVRIDRWYPSSKLCSTPDCEFRNDAMPLDVREWRCPACELTHDRDSNAAKNILAVGLADSNACGGSVSPATVKTGVGNRLRSKNRSARCAAV
jgi:putative transposase